MSIFNRKGKILRLRPGHLANFSGGAGYMPFVVIFSIPASLIFALVSSIFLGKNTRRFRKDAARSDGGEIAGSALHEYVKYLRLHTLTCAIITVVLAVLFFLFAVRMIYDDDAIPYFPAAIVLAGGPFVAWLGSTYLLMKKVRERGLAGFSLPRTIGFYFLFILATLVLGVLMLMMFTQVRF